MKRLLYYPVAVLISALTIVLTSCGDDGPAPPPEPTATDIVKITDGQISAPHWLVAEMENVAGRYQWDPAGSKPYPRVYSFNYKGKEHILVWDALSSISFSAELFFTLDGRRVPEFDPETGMPYDTDLWNEYSDAAEVHKEIWAPVWLSAYY